MSGVRYERPMGDVSRRLHGVIRQLDARAKAARIAAIEAEGGGEVHLAASLRGKARGYNEAIVLLAILDQGRPLRRRVPWPRRGAPAGGRGSGDEGRMG